MHESETPKLCSDNIRPHCHSMEEHHSSTSRDDTNELLDNTILPVGANTAERLILVRGINVVFKDLSGKDSIIAVDVFGAYVIMLSKGFKSYLRF